MPESTSSAHITKSPDPTVADDISDHLPLRLIPSEIIPPSPTRSESTIDWLPDFAGYSWIAYGASSLLVISHFPSPVSESETLIGPLFRQVFELSSDGSGCVSAVCWSPVIPSVGEVAAALDNCIGLYSYNSDASTGSFCWSQTTVLVQSTKIEAIDWTGSGDGIISVGIKVVLWRKKGTLWEIAWNFRPEIPQILVSATWSIEGHLATAPSCTQSAESSAISTARNCVMVYHSDRKNRYVKAELRHPLPVCMIQWRPSTARQSIQDIKHLPRLLLLTCCIDGTVRLWSEIDDARVRKLGKDMNDQIIKRSSFRVSAVIEINDAMNGILGSNIHVRWAVEIHGIFNIGKEENQYFCSENHQPDAVGKCEWLIGFGPQGLVTLWAVHCLDDIAPVRYPRVTLWKRQRLKGPEEGNSSLLLRKVIILRNQVFGPPTVCSLLQLLPCNSLNWFHLNFQTPTTKDESFYPSQSESLLLSSSYETLNMDSHSGKFVQVSVHSHGFESQLAASLDANGLLLLWSISNTSNCIVGLPTLKPSWKLIGKIVVQGSDTIYSSLSWMMAVLDEEPVLLAGHLKGVDCFVVKFSNHEEEKVFYHKLCTIPFTSHSLEEGPTNVYSIPLPSSYDGTFDSNTCMLLAVWKNTFQALSWKMTVHCCDTSGSCGCSCDIRNTVGNNGWTFESNYFGKTYLSLVDPWSSVFPDPHNHSHVTSHAVVCPTNAVLPEEQKGTAAGQLHYNCSPYHIATGCFDGSLKLWRSVSLKSSNLDSQWELVGVVDAHQSPITTVSASDCGRKIATVTPAAQSKCSSTLHVWETVNLSIAGSFMLEDTIFLDGEVVSLNWLKLGNGQLLLGVSLQNRLLVYAQRRCGGPNILNSVISSNRKIWFLLAFAHTYPANRNFFWGPEASAVVVNNGYFTLFSPWLLLVNKKSESRSNSKVSNDNPYDFSASDNMFINIFTDSDISDLKGSLVEEKDKHYRLRSPCEMNVKGGILSNLCVENLKQNYLGIKVSFWSMLDVAEKFGGSLPLYHPEALLVNICSGNWKRAQVALQCLVDYVPSENVNAQKCNHSKSAHIIPVVDLSKYIEGCFSSSSTNKTFQWGGNAALITSSSKGQQGRTHFSTSWGFDGSSSSFTSPSTSSEIRGSGEPLEKLYDLGVISNSEKLQLLAITDLLNEVSNPNAASAYESLDEPGRRFWVAIRFQKLYFVRKFGRMPSLGELVADSCMICWAFHSDCQENLFNSLLPSEPSWHEMRNIGVGFWYTNVTQLRSKMEKLARQQYLKNKDPKSCALLYIALNRLQVLAGLFKISKDEKDKPLVGFLSRNFQEDKNKAAALKNAYVLMGKHQLELAVAFFLLGGDTSSAINVCAKNLADEQLALVICRLVENSGGPLQCQLISKFMLPSAIEKGDYWLASSLEWALGNYYKAFMRMLGFQIDNQSNVPALLSKHDSFLDPSIGEYCLMLATSNSVRNAVGERNATILGRWAILMSATALNKCGLPLEGLEQLTSPLSIAGDSDQGNVPDIANSELLNKMLMPSLNTLNWISADVAIHLELHAKLDMAMQLIIKLLREHPSWTDSNNGSPGVCTNFGSAVQYQMLLESFQNKLQSGLSCFEQKFSLVPLHLIEKVVISFCNNGLALPGYQILLCYTSKDPSIETTNAFGRFLLHPVLSKMLLKAEETAYLFSRYVITCSISCFHLRSCSTESSMTGENRFNWLAGLQFYFRGLVRSLWSLGSILKLYSSSSDEEILNIPIIILNFAVYYVYFASAWLQGNTKGLVLLAKPFLMTYDNGPAHSQSELNKEHLNKLLSDIAEVLTHDSLSVHVQTSVQTNKQGHLDQDSNMTTSIPMDERWKIIRALLWWQMSGFLKHLLCSSSLTVEDNSRHPPNGLFSFLSDSTEVELDRDTIKMQSVLVFADLTKLLKTTCAHISSHCERQLASSMLQKIRNGCSAPTLKWLEEFIQFHSDAHQTPCNQYIDNVNMINNENELSDLEILWNMCADPRVVIHKGFAINSSMWLQDIKRKPPRRWIDLYRSIWREHEAELNCDREGKPGSPISSNGVDSPVSPSNDNIFLGSGGKDSASSAKKAMPFQIPKEICKRNGELLEALCVNSVNQHEAAVASNRKGIIFFSKEDGVPSTSGCNYIWSEVDWPHDGWAGSESTPVPTCVSPGVGLGSRKGTHLGLGGATVGVGLLEKLGRDFADGGASGVPSFAGSSSSGLGWEIQDEFEEFVDPPATVENIRTRAFSSHPSKSLFLVGSSNTHIYLWEFGKERATATYGVLPAANVPPPYALASISAVRFDHCGQRFATAALDGTVCTWQLEVGGRSNVRPTESSLCFNNHASDVTYVTASGSIIAAAGYSSDAVNVVIWDTLAPPTSSRASIMCHEGGARSLCVFDNEIGSGSISPYIVTGGKGGDVGVHDFRYVATGRKKKHKHSDGLEEVVNGSSTTIMRNKIGDQNSNGMLWYIPKAHSGSVTRISAIPNTNFFLTGSKDGDVKLWDAKRAKLVFHWPKLHDKHTFLQGGVVRAAVTDIQVVTNGFLTCGGDGSVKFVQFQKTPLE